MSNKPRGIFEDLAPHVTLLHLVLQLLEAVSQAQNSSLYQIKRKEVGRNLVKQPGLLLPLCGILRSISP